MRTKDTLSRKRTKWLTLAIAFVMTATAVISVIPNDVASDDADGGTYALGAVPGYTGIPDTSWYNSGTTNFNISNADQLAGLARLVNDGEDFSGRSVHIDNDIDLSCYGAENTAFNNGKGWIPIGQNTSVFRGIFNGGDHEITGLYMNDMSAGYGGLFGSVNASDGGYIQNLGVLGTVIIGNGIAGGIAGRYTTLGGMMEMSGCHFEGTVSGTFCVGGIVGRVDDTQTMYGSITGCYSAGEIIVRSTSSLIYVGGIAGQLVGAASIQGCYSTSMIAVSSAATGADVNVGGIAGNMSSSLSFVDHCAALNPSVTVACDVTAVVSIGRVAGYLYPFSSHLDNNVAFNGMKVSVNGVGTPIDDGSGSTVDGSSATVSAINSTNYFYNLFNGSYYYYWVYVALEEGGVLPSNHCGIAHTPLWLRTGVGNMPYEAVIYTASELASLAEKVNAGDPGFYRSDYRLNNDIDLSNYLSEGGAGYNGGKGWIPIGMDGTHAFLGVFDGGGHKVSGLYINAPYVSGSDEGMSYAGLFGYIGYHDDVTIRNLGVAGEITANQYIGGIAGIMGNVSNTSYITNCYSEVNIVSISGGPGTLRSFAGGIVGWIENNDNSFTVNVTNCYATGSVTANALFIGGIIGYVGDHGNITNCYATGEIEGTNGVGGIAGYVSGSINSVKDCAALNSSVKATATTGNAGRVAGYGNTLTNNVAYVGMIITIDGNGKSPLQNTLTGIDGADISAASIISDGTLGGRFANNGNPWTAANTKLPGLFGQTVEMPFDMRPVLTGTATIDNTAPKVGDTLTGYFSGTHMGTLSYTWWVNGAQTGAGEEYTVTAYDYNEIITLKVTSDFETGEISAGTAAVTKADQTAPAAPTVASKTATSVTLDIITGAEYSLDAATWQPSETFSGLDPGTGYTFYARLAETATHNASPASTGTTVMTDKGNQAAPSAPTLDSKTATSVTLDIITGAEYSLDAATWQPSETFSGLDPGTGYTFYARLAETATHNASPASAGTAVTTDKASLDGVVTITGTAQFGETLTADTGALETNVTGYLDFGTLSYEWKRGAAVVGTNAATYVLTAADVGQTITVTVTASNCDGSVASAATSSVSAVAITDAAIAVTAPVTGATPGTTATGTGNFTVSAVSWTPSDTIFLGGTVYEVTVVLDAAAGYTFAGSATATVNGDAAVIGSNTGTSLTLSYEFAATGTADVTGVDVISQPSKLTYTHGEALELAGFSVKVSYSDGTDDTVPFAQFTAKGISVSIADGTTLSRDTHNGTAVEVSCGTFSAFTDALIVSKAAYTPAAPTASGSFVYGTELSEWDLSADVRGTWSWADGSMIPDVTNGGYEAVFVLTDDNYTLASGGTATVSVTVTRAAVDITAVQGVTVPALGGTPVAFVTETDQYTGTVAWDPVVAVTFGPSTVYTATITLTAKDNYTFTGVAADMFTIFGAVCANAADGNVITAVFPETGDVLDTTPPEIVSVTPSGSDVALSGTIVITFDKPMDQTVGTVALDNGIGALTGGTWTSATSYSVPFGGLAEGTSYTVTASGFRDASGNGMTDNSEYGFATVAPEPRDDGGNGTDGGDDTGDDNILLYIVIIAAIAIVALVAVYLLLIRKP